ncbi:MAG: AMP-binding protein [Desulfobacterales bacterium]|nr:MAG: AMP-binding protein [Desulfobacterales bacterium]
MRVMGDIPRLNARRYPGKKALIMGDNSMTFKQLNNSANRLANGLISSGIRSGDKVAIMAQNCMEFPVIVYAVAKCGAVLVPINFRYEKKELIYVAENSDPKMLFFGAENGSLILDAANDFDKYIKIIAISENGPSKGLSLKSLMKEQSEIEPAVIVNPDSAAMIMYTSGTTGFPSL